MLRWLSVAPLGNPVVPEVYWMLIGSVFVSPACMPLSSLADTSSAWASSSSQSDVPM